MDFAFFKNENERDFDFFKVENASALNGKQGGVIFLFSRRRGVVFFGRGRNLFLPRFLRGGKSKGAGKKSKFGRAERNAPPPMTKGKRPCIG